MDNETLEDIIKDAARNCQLDADLVLAISYVETGLNPYLVRFEPNWKYFVTPEKYASRLGITEPTERTLQAMSWGPAQIMASNCRSLGYSGLIPLLIKPQLSMLYACKYLQTLQRKFSSELDIISSYNQGSPDKINGVYKNNLYVLKVSNRLQSLRGD